jgi:predicted DNA-binding transcriptional regulator YafY
VSFIVTKICHFKKGRQSISLFAIKSHNEFWLEIEKDGKVETTDRVYSWNGAIALLEANNWNDYEINKMDTNYFDLILAARSNTNSRRRNHNAQQRLLEILRRLEGQEIVKMEQAIEEYRIGRAQIQRDVREINGFYQYTNKEVIYDRREKGYKLNTKGDYFTIDDALLVLLLLYGTRTLNKEELKQFSGKLIALFSIEEQIKIREFFQSYLFHYEAVQQENLFELFYICFQAITKKRILKFSYTNNRGETGVREVIPYTITFHDRKFYLLARKKDSDSIEPYSWQLDRIKDCVITKQSAPALPANFQVGEYIQKAFNLYGGEPHKVRMRVRNTNIEYLKRNFPKVSIEPTSDEEWFDVQVEVLGFNGIKLWIFKQGPHVEVLEPLSLREEVIKEIREMYQIYNGAEQFI